VLASISNFIFSLPTSLFSQQQPEQQQQPNTDYTVNTHENNTDYISSSMYDTNLPITGICLISKSNNVPTGYHCIRKGRKRTKIIN